MATGKPKDKKDKSKKKYVKPKISRHGSLQGIAERVTGLTLLCCLTERARAARTSPSERRRLVDDVAGAFSAR